MVFWRLATVVSFSCTALIVGCGESETRESRDIGPYAIAALDTQEDASDAASLNDSGLIVGSANTPVAWESGKVMILGSELGKATAVNDSGQIVGQRVSGDAYHAFLWEDGRFTDLGAPGKWQSGASDINDHGQIVGDLDDGEHAFLWEDGEMTDLGTLTVDRVWEYADCSASAINNRTEIVGRCRGALDEVRAFRWVDGKMTDLGTLGGDICEAADLNDQGEIVGSSTTLPGQEQQDMHAFSWKDGEMTDLGTLGGRLSVATAINERGQIVGFSSTPGGWLHAFLWEDGEMTDLGALTPDSNSFAGDINDSGLVVGTSGPGWGGQAVLWERA